MTPQSHYNSLQEAQVWLHIPTQSGSNRHRSAPHSPDPLELRARIWCCRRFPYNTLHFNCTHTYRELCARYFICLPISRGRGRLPCKPSPLYPDIWFLWEQFQIVPRTMILTVTLVLLSPRTHWQIRFKPRHEFSRVWREQLVQGDSWRWKACGVSQFLIVSAVRKQLSTVAHNISCA